MFQQELITRIKLPFNRKRKLYSDFHKMLGFYPLHIQFYEQALLHKSSSVKKAGAWINNERLEFLGDAILDAVVGDIVFRHFSGKKEGFLTNTRSKIVQRETLNKIAIEIGLDKLIVSSTHTNSHNNYMYGNAFEALVGAIYLDRGYEYCMRFIQKRILKERIDIDRIAYKEVNFKSKLIEWGQKNHVRTSFMLVEQKTEEQTSPVFISQVLLEGIPCEKGRGYSKKESQQAAAKETLNVLKQSPDLLRMILEKKEENMQQQRPEDIAIEPTAQADITNDEENGNTSLQETADTPETTCNINLNTADFDLSDITIRRNVKNKEGIIAEAEAAAYANNI